MRVARPYSVDQGRLLILLGIKSIDALHIACAITAGYDLFVITDDTWLFKLRGYRKLVVLPPGYHPVMRSLNWSAGMKIEAEIRQVGINAPIQALCTVEAEQFIAALTRDRFDYTEWRQTGLPDLDIEMLSAQACAILPHPGSLMS